MIRKSKLALSSCIVMFFASLNSNVFAAELSVESPQISPEKKKLLAAYKLISKSDYDKAIPLLEKLLKLNKQDLEAHRYLAHCYLHKGQVALALAESKVLSSSGSGLPHDAFAAGEANFYSGNISEAIKCYIEALKLNPVFVEARVGVIRSLVALGKFQEAKKICLEAAAKSPGEKNKRQFRRLLTELEAKTQIASSISYGS